MTEIGKGSLEDKAYDEQRHVSCNITEMCRYINFGIIAASYTLISSDNASAIKILETIPRAIVAPAYFSAVSLALDYLQFTSAYLNIREAIKSKTFLHDSSLWTYVCRDALFWGKQLFCVIAIVFFIANLVRYAQIL